MAKISREARAELVSAVAARYRASSKCDKTRILDEFVRVTGYHRKHAVRVLQGKAEGEKPRSAPRPTLYDEATRQALVVLWEASDRICGVPSASVHELSRGSAYGRLRRDFSGIPRRRSRPCRDLEPHFQLRW